MRSASGLQKRAGWRRRLFRLVGTVLGAVVVIVPVTVAGAMSAPGARTASSAQVTGTSHAVQASSASGFTGTPVLPAPPRPPSERPVLPARFEDPSALVGGPSRASTQSTPPAPAQGGRLALDATVVSGGNPPQAVTWGSGTHSTLVLYDTTGTWGYLGELYAEMTGNLVTHYGTVTTEPVVDYVPGQLDSFSAVIYIGSTYNEPLPASFLNDVLSSTIPVMWMGDNVWQLSGTGTADAAFRAKYGWDPSTSYFDFTDTVGQIEYNGQTFGRNTLAGPIVAPHLTPEPGSAPVTQLGQAVCESPTLVVQPCHPIAQSPGGPTATTYPWAIQSANLTYIGEVPLSYINETDRYLAFAGLLQVLDPTVAPTPHVALVRLEDLNATDTAHELVKIAQYLHNEGVPFSMNVIADYVDPTGYYNTGVPQNLPLSGPSQTSKAFVSALKQMISLGGTLNMEGYTHQYTAPGAVYTPNPYDGVSGDDFEFYRAQCSTTGVPPYNFTNYCTNTEHVIEEGPLPTDSASWAASRISAATQQYMAAGLPVPRLFVAPHYAASAVDYAQIASAFSGPSRGAYGRRLYFGGELTPGASINYSHVAGQFFPYAVQDLYGTNVVPEDLGDYEPIPLNYNPVRTAPDIVAEAKGDLAVPGGTASFFFTPWNFTTNPNGVLQTIISGIKSLGYTFVSPLSLLPSGGTATASSAVTAAPVASATAAFSSSAVHAGPAAVTAVRIREIARRRDA